MEDALNKKCSRCRTVKSMGEFPNDSNRCYICAQILKDKKRIYDKEYRRVNKEKKQQHDKEYYDQNREERLKYGREYNITHKDERRRYRKKKIKERTAYNKKYYHEHERNNVECKIKKLLRSRVVRITRGQIKAGSAVNDLGCTIPEFIKYLESRFQPGMTWENLGRGWGDAGYKEWHVDHIIALSKFDLTDRNQFLRACHYTNLQPLWAADDLCKGAR